jgi:hypothetical protein
VRQSALRRLLCSCCLTPESTEENIWWTILWPIRQFQFLHTKIERILLKKNAESLWKQMEQHKKHIIHGILFYTAGCQVSGLFLTRVARYGKNAKPEIASIYTIRCNPHNFPLKINVLFWDPLNFLVKSRGLVTLFQSKLVESKNHHTRQILIHRLGK